MTKECKVLLRNKLVMVVDFDGKEIQMPSDHATTNTVFVKYENDRYTITDKLEEKKPKMKPVSRVKKQKKVTEVELAKDVTPEESDEKSE